MELENSKIVESFQTKNATGCIDLIFEIEFVVLTAKSRFFFAGCGLKVHWRVGVLSSMATSTARLFQAAGTEQKMHKGGFTHGRFPIQTTAKRASLKHLHPLTPPHLAEASHNTPHTIFCHHFFHH